MKRIIKGLTLFILVVLSLTIIHPTNANALLQQISFININDSNKSLTVGNLSFSNITFKDYSSNSTLSFGLTGTVVNSSNQTIDYTSTAYYYDANYNLIAQGYNSGTALNGTNDFNQMSNISILSGHDVSEIYYYSIVVNVIDGLGYEENISITPSKNNQYKGYEYVIDKYDINIIVNENNTLDITETITAYFNVAKHGIYRTIPLKNNVVRLDGTASKNRTQITNLTVDNEYKTSRENGNYKIQIGSASKTITGEQTYVIKYNYNLGKDHIKNYDELYYNIIGDEWDTVIGNITFTITMPKDFDSSKLGFSSGKKGSTNNSNIRYNVKENKITGSYEGILGVNEALTVRCELEEGYFVNAGIPINKSVYLPLSIFIIFLGISIFLWYKFGRDDQVIETVEFYPPEGFNSLDVGFLYKGTADNKDVTSLLIYLANKGYIKISENKEKADFKIIKLKEYDGNNINEQLFLEGLFTKKQKKSIFSLDVDNTEEKINEVTLLDLTDNFYTTKNKILSNVNSKENKEKIFEKKASNKSIFIVLLLIITYCIMTIPPVIIYGDKNTLLFALLFSGVGFSLTFTLLFGNQTEGNDTSILTRICGIICGLVFAGIPWIVLVLPTLLPEPMYLIIYIVGLVCAFGMAICLKYLPKRTKYGNEMLGKLKGFKNYLETAEKEKLEAMVMQDPTYFYNILPYTYVLGVSDIWIKKFETISLQEPDWYDSPNGFDMITFGTFMDTSMDLVQSAMTSSPSSDSGGSGGGSSGGGSGGGGGGSW